jgi:hypothetical protein
MRVRLCVVFDVMMATGYLYMTACPAEVSETLLANELSTALVLIYPECCVAIMSLVYEGTMRVLPLVGPASVISLIPTISVAKLDEALPLNWLCGLIVGVFSFLALICLSPFFPFTIILKF